MTEKTMSYKCLKVADGVIVLVEHPGISRVASKNISIYVSDPGVVVQIGDIQIPLTDVILEHVASNPRIAVFFTSVDRYVEQDLLTVDLDQKALLEAKGAWEFEKGLDADMA